MERHDRETLEAVDELLEADRKNPLDPDSKTNGPEEQLAAAAAVGSMEVSEEVGAKEMVDEVVEWDPGCTNHDLRVGVDSENMEVADPRHRKTRLQDQDDRLEHLAEEEKEEEEETPEKEVVAAAAAAAAAGLPRRHSLSDSVAFSCDCVWEVEDSAGVSVADQALEEKAVQHPPSRQRLQEQVSPAKWRLFRSLSPERRFGN